ncbi:MULTISPECIES: carbohydrate ABC transporter permease [unclassified Oceanispirochaeta]|uniref:carbohydrate ABC transporter permease n=1 Tax=unclassified Oceanispirochaeta TaxID=2635722 RepID=UPI000E098819|nr:MULTISPECIES: sugar ABC transporter permease [unclassified Oceanispirochaeta]MBF9015372.1 sugar ABC transporter permease [Oceanispirochaeta sp. M2]NPD71831.1 sugar ABC transporter permease [Oceanispirochaeta sp. M1]RDG32642.1 sugar ABC transporter permease [Oceanispirochaeta sp. M1]
MNKKMKRRLSNIGWGYFMILPTVIGLVILNLWPMIQSFYLSLCSSGDFGQFKWEGLGNYYELISDPDFWLSMRNTVLFTLYTVPLGVFFSLITAQFLNTGIKARSLFRTLFFIPVVSAPAAVAMIWRWIYNADYGILNQLLGMVYIQGPSWNTDPAWSLISIAAIAIWSSVGYNMIILLAGLQGIPKMYYEASTIDGASPLRSYFSITLPLLTPSIFFVVITSVINGLKQFDLIYMMFESNNSNPAYPGTRTLVRYYYQKGFELMDKAYASSVIMGLLIVIMIVTWIQFRGQKRWVHYGD